MQTTQSGIENGTERMVTFYLNNATVQGQPYHQASSNDSLSIPVYIYCTITIAYLLVFLFGISGNVLVVFVVWRNADMRNTTNLFLTNLSAADLQVLIVCMPAALTEFYAKDIWLLGRFMCRVVPYLENTVSHASILTILCISFERYFAICHPLKVQYICTKRRVLKVIATIWIISLAVTTPFVAMSYVEEAVFYDGRLVQVCRTPVNSNWKTVYIISLAVVFFAFPLLVLVTAYILIAKKLLFCEPPKRYFSGLLQQGSHRKNRGQVIYMLMAIIVLFFVCLLPFRVLTIWFIFSTPDDTNRLGLEGYLNLMCFVRVMYYINSAGNPVLYNILSSRFREAFKRALSAKYRQQMRHDSVASTLDTFYNKRDICGSHERLTVNSDPANESQERGIVLTLLPGDVEQH